MLLHCLMVSLLLEDIIWDYAINRITIHDANLANLCDQRGPYMTLKQFWYNHSRRIWDYVNIQVINIIAVCDGYQNIHNRFSLALYTSAIKLGHMKKHQLFGTKPLPKSRPRSINLKRLMRIWPRPQSEQLSNYPPRAFWEGHHRVVVALFSQSSWRNGQLGVPLWLWPVV